MTERTLQIKVEQTGDAKKGIDALSVATGNIVSDLALKGIDALGSGLESTVQAAMEAEEGQAELLAVLKSTGGAAGVTAEMANELASRYQRLTRFSDDAILSGENMLLTFTSIGKDVFPGATEAVLDLATKFGSVEQASIQVGKALNDPIAGVTALRRVGVQLTDAQEAQIKKFVEMGDIASAQKIILAELKTEFGGLAIAAGNTTVGGIDKLANRIGDLQEKIGGALLPVVNALFPPFDAFLTELEEVGGQAIPVINDALTRMARAFGVNTDSVTTTDVIVKGFKMVLDSVIIAIKLATVVIKLLADGVEQGRRNWEAIKSTVNAVKDTFNNSMNSIKNGVNSAINKWNDFKHAVRDAVDAIPDWLIPHSPTKFQIGLEGIAKATGDVAAKFPSTFAVPQTGGLAMAGAGGGSPIIIQLDYHPVVSTADKFELEELLREVVEKITRERR